MNCKTCDYSLWALKTHQCPECGRPFVPSEFDFVPGSVRFACPFCDQSYYGTAANGHLVPAEFNCVRCGRPVGMDEMVLFPAEGVQERQTRPEGHPWLEREERGRIGGWFRTLGLALVGPQRLMALTPAESSVGSAWWFALVTQILFSVVGIMPLVMFPLIMMSAMRAGPGATGMGFAFGGVLLVVWFGPMVMIAIWGLVTHAILKVTGGTEHTIGRTYQALCYSSGANVLMAAPCVGMHLTFSGISSIWWIVSAVLMVKEGQRVHGGRAALAVLTLPVLMIAGGIVLVTLAVMGFSRAGFNARTTASSSAFSQQVVAQQINAALNSYATQHNGRLPGHAIELFTGNYLSDPDVLLLSDAAKRRSKIPLADKTLADFPNLSIEEQRRMVKAVNGGLTGKIVAHRLGDVVFTYHGIKPDSADGDLWLFIIWPDAASGGDTSELMVTVGRRNGTWQFPAAQMPKNLAAQNRLRAQYGLPPLPHPKDVPHVKAAPAAEKVPAAEEGPD